MTTADLTVGAPGRPDSGTELGGHEVPLDGSWEGDDDGITSPITVESVKGLVLTATNMLHMGLAGSFPERPDIAVMNEDEAERIAGALISMAARNATLRAALERSDLAVLVVTLAGYTGRVTNDVVGARRQRKEQHDTQDPQGQPGRHLPAGSGEGLRGQPGGGLQPDSPGGGRVPPLG